MIRALSPMYRWDSVIIPKRSPSGRYLRWEERASVASLELANDWKETNNALEDDVDDGGSLDDSVNRDNGGVRRGESVEGELSSLEVSLTCVKSDVVKALDGCRVREGKQVKQISRCLYNRLG